MGTYNIAVIKGDGIGPEVTGAAMDVLTKVGERFSHKFNFTESICGGAAYDKYGEPLPQESLDVCLKSDSVLLGAVGGPQYDSLPYEKRPERALLGVRKAMGLYANLRPARLFKPRQDRPACGARAYRRHLLRRKGHAPRQIRSGRLRRDGLRRT